MRKARRKARVAALQALYEYDVARHQAVEVLSRLSEEEELSEENRVFAAGLVTGIVAHIKELDGEIRRFAPAWPVEQLPAIDRNILRLAIFEVLFDNKVPVKVAINEAVELAKAFGSDNSPRFINGVLGSVSSQNAQIKDLKRG